MAETRSDPVKVVIAGKGSLVIGGGDGGRYLVVYFPELHPMLPSLTLVDVTATGLDIPLHIDTPMLFPARYAVPTALVLLVVEAFVQTGQIPAHVYWEDDRTKKETSNAGREVREGQQWGNYVLRALLWRGEGTEHYLAHTPGSSQLLVVKIAEMTFQAEQRVERFIAEAQTLSRLTHPHILPLLDWGIKQHLPFLVTPFLAWGSFRDLYGGRTMSVKALVRPLKEVASALDYAHQHQQVHGKVKPEHMLIGSHHEILLSDFRIPLLSPHSVEAQPEEAVYLAPEHIQGHLQAASDQYALGVVAYERLCGVPPFEGTPSEMIQQHLSVPPPPLSKRVSTLSPAIDRVILRVLAKDPHARFENVTAFVQALENTQMQ
jgi:serine/threonine protein kinase